MATEFGRNQNIALAINSREQSSPRLGGGTLAELKTEVSAKYPRVSERNQIYRQAQIELVP